jgi:2-amino-4-hydroxy-6-hydroxymethyldihydropteridine diphosphokinase
MREVIFGLGANLGEPRLQLARAVEMLAEVVEVASCSSVYRSEPAGFRDQPDFFNLIVLARSAEDPGVLLGEALRIERELGRARTFRNAPRSIDIDLISWSGPPVETPELVLPHPRLHQRAFVLVPLAEVAPSWRHPLLGSTASELLAALGDAGRIERVGELPAIS